MVCDLFLFSYLISEGLEKHIDSIFFFFGVMVTCVWLLIYGYCINFLLMYMCVIHKVSELLVAYAVPSSNVLYSLSLNASCLI